MFAKTIVTSDAFLDLPLSARCLYFTLGMFADDDGFVNNPKSIMRQVGASTDDMNLLICKRFILTFDSGIIVIKHWRIHNYIAKDRYKETKYIDEKKQLSLDEKGAYTECIQPVYRMDTQVSRGKESLGKERVVEVSEMPDSDGTPPQIECLRDKLGKGVVYLTPEQDEDLMDKLGLEGYDLYIEKLADFIIKNNAKVANHYQTILKWYEEDTRV